MFPKNGQLYPEVRFPEFTDAWEQRKLGEICERITRKNKGNESDLPLTIASQYGLIDQRDFFNKVVAAKDMTNYYLLKKGEFAYNKSYSNGFDYGSIKRLNEYEKGCLSTLYVCFGITSDEVDSDYLECFFDTLNWYHDVATICAEGARNHGLLNVDVKAFFTDVKISLPLQKEEQKRIAECFQQVDTLITLHQRKLDHVKDLKKSMLQKMFPKNGQLYPEVRFPEFTDAWEQRKVGDVLTESRDLGHSGDIAKKLTVKLWGKGVCAKDDKGSASTQYFIRHAEQFIYSKLDFLNSAFGVIPNELENYESTADLPAFNCIGVNPYFMFYRAIQPSFYLTNGMIADGSRKAKRIHVNTFLEMPLDLPSMDEQRKIENFFTSLDHLITLHQRKLDHLKLLKKGMLQQMFV